MTGYYQGPKCKLWLELHAQYIFANSFNFLVTWALLVTVFHSMYVFCVYSMALYWPTLHFYVCMYISFVCQYVAPPGECYYNALLRCKKYFSLTSVVSCTFSALCVYSNFGHHRHPLGYIWAKFCFFRDLLLSSPWRKIAYSITQSPSLLDAPGIKACTSEYQVKESGFDAE